ncbi:hypothetical protein [Yersinia aldovae]|uniref:hypothetical protein n=1 Tax=Yersinia aldovae TaxID=29483 RepID=UPI0005AD1362|nr:hypothetical protein [Yersinia aldovae]AJJ61730.1 macrolide export ATP-binding/permease MacB domain protein [Yersinia aldovae 670-83]
MAVLIGAVSWIERTQIINIVAFSSSFSMVYSVKSIITAFICSSLIGVVFGFFPAKRAAQMDPIRALERE